MPAMTDIEEKADIEHIGVAHVLNDDNAQGDDVVKPAVIERVELTEADNKRILRKTDLHVLTILTWVYFLQILDKTVFGQGNVWGLSTDLKLVGNQYAFAGSIHAIAQVAWQPFSSYLIVKVPARYLMTALVFGWGVAEATMAASSNYHHLLVTRFFLGLFEAGCLPLFSVMTAQWYRRSEQPLRVACWYGTNGLATIFASLLSYACGQIKSDVIKPWQAIYMIAGILTVATAPLVWYLVDSDIASARFLNEEEKAMAVERLRANQTGTGSHSYKWEHVWEVFYDLKTISWVGMVFLLNTGAAVTGIFGPTLIKGFGFSKSVTALLNMPFGALQVMVILIGCFAAQKFRWKSPVLAVLMAVTVIGSGLLYSQGTTKHFNRGVALLGYYLLATLFGGNPLLVSWIMGNTGGQTKKSVVMAAYNLASGVGNVVGPLLFNAKDAPHYLPGLRAVLIVFCVMLGVIALQVFVLKMYNKKHESSRVAEGKPAQIHDTSMEEKYQAYGSDEHDERLGQSALLDLTDLKNNEMTYVY